MLIRCIATSPRDTACLAHAVSLTAFLITLACAFHPCSVIHLYYGQIAIPTIIRLSFPFPSVKFISRSHGVPAGLFSALLWGITSLVRRKCADAFELGLAVALFAEFLCIL